MPKKAQVLEKFRTQFGERKGTDLGTTPSTNQQTAQEELLFFLGLLREPISFQSSKRIIIYKEEGAVPSFEGSSVRSS